jgi:nucleotide-binding universal stress UspA family protein
MKIEKILFPTKFRELSFNSLESLFILKNAGLKEIILCYVIPRDEVGFVPFGGYLKDEEERLREEARIRFKDWQDSIAKNGISSKIIIEVGDPVPKILSVAERENIDFIVVGKKQRAFFKNSFLGSNSMKIISRIKVPALVSKYMVEFEYKGESVSRINKDKFLRPLFATDWAEPSERALNLLITLGSIVEKAFVCHVIESKDSKSIDKSEVHTLENETRDKLESYCDRLKSAGIDVENHLGAGNVSEEIIRMSRECEASMIIMGTTSKSRLHELFLGSNSHQIAQTSELPTLLVP